eukprot:CAMPEP_0184307736 /NCGR_PEP_ID=MMETSP1049-20130417/16401_1 /TAXON_ID=77928 /ORGANISM="Proteomonas sulcata, Strain CCMP704" /LENGTH=180 /DNA_ID=CAMNT_0026620291 /DNA_START=509 /DNA_END=1048 /DNA_ORIENTATION=-
MAPILEIDPPDLSHKFIAPSHQLVGPVRVLVIGGVFDFRDPHCGLRRQGAKKSWEQELLLPTLSTDRAGLAPRFSTPPQSKGRATRVGEKAAPPFRSWADVVEGSAVIRTLGASARLIARCLGAGEPEEDREEGGDLLRSRPSPFSRPDRTAPALLALPASNICTILLLLSSYPPSGLFH